MLPNVGEGGIGLRLVDCRQKPAVPIGTFGDFPLLGKENLTIFEADRSDGSLAENQYVFIGQSEIVVLFEERDGLFVRGRTRLNTERDPGMVLFGHRPNPFDVDLKQGDSRDRSDRIDPLRAEKIEPGSLTTRDDRRCQFPGTQGLFADGNGL